MRVSILAAVTLAAGSAFAQNSTGNYTSFCPSCQSLLGYYVGLAQQGDANFSTTVGNLCAVAGIEDADVCRGALDEQGPILAHGLREMTIPSHTSDLLCLAVFGLCPTYPPVRPYQVQFPKPKPANAARPPPSGKTPIQVIQFSDIHVDLSYEVGSNYNCTKPICCRSYTPADAPGNNSYPAQEFGSPLCDSPVSLEESMYAAATQEFAPDHDFALFTGDIVEGAVWLVTESENLNDINDAYASRMSKYFDKLYGTAGNHESAPVNAFVTGDPNIPFSSQWVYDKLAASWSEWIGPDAADFVKQFGAYSVDHSDKLKIISFDSNFYYYQNYWLYTPEMPYDPYGQFQWLVNELQNAEDAGQNAWIIAHMPMGSSSAMQDPSNYFNQIVERYSATIAAMFFGHTHKDQFEITYSDYSQQTYQNAISTAYIAQSLTPRSGAPAFRVYEVDPETYAVLDFTVYTADLTQEGCYGPAWEKFYSAKETYGSQLSPPVTDPSVEMTPAFWHNVTELFETNDAEFQKYFARRNGLTSTSACTGSCKDSEICGMRAGESQYNCVRLTKGINFKRSEPQVPGQFPIIETDDTCAGVGHGALLATFALDEDEIKYHLGRS